MIKICVFSCFQGINETMGSELTVDKCTALCTGKGYAYSGLKGGKDCLCDNTYGFHGATNSKCSKCMVLGGCDNAVRLYIFDSVG